MAYIEFRGINKFYGDNHVLKNISLSVEKGQFVTLLGPSGCGKSTLLRCLAGLDAVTGGELFVDGENITHREPRARSVGMVFQQYSLFPNMTVAENIAFGLKMKKEPADVVQAKVADAVRMVELEGKENQLPGSLSGGQQQRVALARAIVTQPKVLLLDEPLSAIDAKLRKSLQSRIKEIHRELGLTCIFVTHDQDEAMILSDVIHLFHAGQIEQSSTPIALYTAPRTKFTASFIGHYNLLTPAQFCKLTGETCGNGESIAIRPETLEILTEPAQRENCILLEGVVRDNTSHGNVLRYDVQVGDVMLEVDVLFRSFHLYENGTKIWLSCEKRNCLRIQEGA